jgi:hypothetical protein
MNEEQSEETFVPFWFIFLLKNKGVKAKMK